jgi:hypothetical protein
MQNWQTITVSLFGLFSFVGFLLGIKNSSTRKNPYGFARLFNIIGAFVWADTVVFGLFWVIICSIVLLFANWFLFLLTLSVFWLVRSIGETFYWFNQQFSQRNRNPFKENLLAKIFPGDSSWVAMQIFWQCAAVASGVTTIYLIKILFV